jgi:phage/plasmid primase-like uncharacterized protein
MKVFVIFSILAVGAYGARLDNRYIPPPPNAHSAGGYNLDTPKQALPSNIQSSYSAPDGAQSRFQQQSQQGPGFNQGTFTSHSHGNGFQSVSAGSYSSSAGSQPQSGYTQQSSYSQAPQQQSYNPQPQQNYQAKQQSYQPQPQYNSYQQSGYNQASTTPIPILKCK